MCSCCSASGQCLFPGACLPCNKGFYQPLSGQQQCWPCNRGYFAKYTHCVNLFTAGVSYCFVYITRVIVLTVLLGVLYATPARLVPSTTILEQTVAQVAQQVCLYNGDKLNSSSLFFSHHKKISVGTCLVCCPQVSIRPIRVPPHVHHAHRELSASKSAPAWTAQGCLCRTHWETLTVHHRMLSW